MAGSILTNLTALSRPEIIICAQACLQALSNIKLRSGKPVEEWRNVEIEIRRFLKTRQQQHPEQTVEAEPFVQFMRFIIETVPSQDGNARTLPFEQRPFYQTPSGTLVTLSETQKILQRCEKALNQKWQLELMGCTREADGNYTPLGGHHQVGSASVTQLAAAAQRAVHELSGKTLAQEGAARIGQQLSRHRCAHIYPHAMDAFNPSDTHMFIEANYCHHSSLNPLGSKTNEANYHDAVFSEQFFKMLASAYSITPVGPTPEHGGVRYANSYCHGQKEGDPVTHSVYISGRVMNDIYRKLKRTPSVAHTADAPGILASTQMPKRKTSNLPIPDIAHALLDQMANHKGIVARDALGGFSDYEIELAAGLIRCSIAFGHNPCSLVTDYDYVDNKRIKAVRVHTPDETHIEAIAENLDHLTDQLTNHHRVMRVEIDGNSRYLQYDDSKPNALLGGVAKCYEEHFHRQFSNFDRSLLTKLEANSTASQHWKDADEQPHSMKITVYRPLMAAIPDEPDLQFMPAHCRDAVAHLLNCMEQKPSHEPDSNVAKIGHTNIIHFYVNTLEVDMKNLCSELGIAAQQRERS